MVKHTQDCPLFCGETAEYCCVDGNRKYFKCDKCIYFQISKRAEEFLLGLSQDQRDIYARQAPRAPAEHMLTILMPDAQHRDKSSDTLNAAFVPKKDLPLECE